MKLAVKSWLSSIPAEWRWTLQRLRGVLAAPGTKHSSRKTDFSYSLRKRETQTSISVGTRAGFWYPVPLPWDQRFCVLFSHIQRERCTWVVLKNPRQTKNTTTFTSHSADSERSEWNTTRIWCWGCKLLPISSLPLHLRHSWTSFRVH